jgi:hypothetical protein
MRLGLIPARVSTCRQERAWENLAKASILARAVVHPLFLRTVPMIVLKKDIVRASTERLEMQTSLASY